jgi:hypothetical protein
MVKKIARDEAGVSSYEKTQPGLPPPYEHVASYPPAGKRDPAGGAYVHLDDVRGHHVYFLPGATLDPGPALPGTGIHPGAATQDGHMLRSADVNPVLRAMNVKNRRVWAKGQP